MAGTRAPGARRAAAGLAPLAAAAAMAAYLLGPGAALVDLGTPLPELAIERVEFHDREIRATVRNVGPEPVVVAVADVNDRIQPAAVEPDASLGRLESAVVRIPFDWNEAEPYAIGVTVSDGTRFERLVGAAAPALEPDAGLLGTFALVGAYVGILPVMIGLAWLPFIRGMSGPRYVFVLSVTAGLLLFLAVDASAEALEVSAAGLSGGLGGPALVATAVAASFLGLYCAGTRLAGRAAAGPPRPMAVALMVAVGIGMHNLGEGLAIGAAVGLGQAALGASLIVGFAVHNTTEGVAIAAPLSRGRAPVPALAGLGMVAGAPAILGAWIGGLLYSPLAAVLFLSVGVGAVLQVLAVIARWIRREGYGPSAAPVAGGVALGMGVMYATGLLV